MSAERTGAEIGGARTKTIREISDNLASVRAGALAKAKLESSTTPSSENVAREAVQHSDFAAISYIWIRLKGRASRLRRQAASRAHRELLLLNEPTFDSSSDDKLSMVRDPQSQHGYERLAKSHTLQRAVHCLTEKEITLIFELFWNQKSVAQLCVDLHVSKNSILKMKRNALKKLHRAVQGIERMR